MTYRNAAEALTGHGYDPRSTPVDVLMAAPCGVGLSVAEAMEDDGNYADDDYGFEPWDGDEELH
jgi:hypothetical protein